jgi:hypothetical protein
MRAAPPGGDPRHRKRDSQTYGTASDAGNATDFEHIAKIGIHFDFQVCCHKVMGEVLHLESLIELAAPEQSAAMNGELPRSDERATVIIKRWIGEVRAENDIVSADGATKKLRNNATDP